MNDDIEHYENICARGLTGVAEHELPSHIRERALKNEGGFRREKYTNGIFEYYRIKYSAKEASQ